MEKKNIDWSNIGFGYIKTDKRFVSNYKDGKWDEGVPVSYTHLTIGIFMFADINMGGAHIGIAAALLSGIFYSFFVIYIDRSGLGDMDYIKLTFYMLLIMSAATLSFGVIVHGINFDMSARSWWMALIISALSTLIALPLFQAGVRYEGASTAGIMSAFEPVTSIAAGALFLGEYVGLMQIFGAALIILGIEMCIRDSFWIAVLSCRAWV